MRSMAVVAAVVTWCASSLCPCPGGDAQPPGAPEAERSHHDEALGVLRAEARKLFAEILRRMDHELKADMLKDLKCKEEDLLERMVGLFLRSSEGALILSERECEEIAAGRFENAKNLKKVREAIEVLAKLEVPLPLGLTVLIEKCNAGTIQEGAGLELAARLLGHHASAAQAMLEATKHGVAGAAGPKATPPLPSENESKAAAPSPAVKAPAEKSAEKPSPPK